MQIHAADVLHPEWKTGLKAQTFFENGRDADAQPSAHAILKQITTANQAAQAFDDITYDKGAAVITMLADDMGADAFRTGVQRYMRAHAYGSHGGRRSVERDAGGGRKADPRHRA
jgi:aminopeptidase N